jgi:hypothetical protein
VGVNVKMYGTENMNLRQFILQNQDQKARAWVRERGFDGLYVRLTHRYLCGQRVHSLDIANIHATVPGQGHFTRIIEMVRTNFPDLWIYLENVQDPRFCQGLERRGFRVSNANLTPPSYYLEPQRQLIS